jgi:hypothetical protein
VEIEKLTADFPPFSAQILDVIKQTDTRVYINLWLVCLLQRLNQQIKNFYFLEDQFQVDALTGLRRARLAPAVVVAARAAAHRLCYRLMCFRAILFVDGDGDHFCKRLLVKELALQPFAELNALCRRLLNLRLLLEGVEVKKGPQMAS